MEKPFPYGVMQLGRVICKQESQEGEAAGMGLSQPIIGQLEEKVKGLGMTLNFLSLLLSTIFFLCTDLFPIK